MLVCNIYSVLKDAKKIFPDHVNVDLIFGRPGQTLDSWREELKEVQCIFSMICMNL